jgi:hypothetical protein
VSVGVYDTGGVKAGTFKAASASSLASEEIDSATTSARGANAITGA